MIRGVMIRLMLTFAGLSMFAITADAQGFRVSALGTGSFLFNENFFTRDGDPWRSNYAPGGRIIFSGEYSRNSVIGFEGAYAYGRNNLRVTDLDTNEEMGYGVRVQRLSTNLMIHSPVKLIGLQPYGTAGVEYARLSPTSEAKALAFAGGVAGDPALLETSNKFGFNAGGGVEWYLVPAIALRLDVRNHFTGTPRFGLNQSQFPVTGTANNVEFSAGFTLHLGD